MCHSSAIELITGSMRNALYATAVAWLLVTPIPTLASVWTLDHGARDEADPAGIAIEESGEAQSIAPLGDDEAWLVSENALRRVSRDRQTKARVDLAGRHFGSAVASAVDVYDGSVWVATSSSLLLRFSVTGALEQGLTTGTPVRMLAMDPDQSVWTIDDDALRHVARDGRSLEIRALDVAPPENPVALAVDALHDRLWIATSRGIYRADRSRSSIMRPVMLGDVAALAVDPQSGVAAVIVDGSIAAFDADGEATNRFDLSLENDDQAIALVFDASQRVFVVHTTRARIRVAPNGAIVERILAAGSATLAGSPFRIEPSLTLMRPPDGGATTDSLAEIVLSIGALCNGSPCDVPRSYLENVRLTAALNSIPLGETRIDAATGRAIFPRQIPMVPGTNRVSAQVVDEFGHDALLDGAQWTLLPNGPGTGEAPRSSSQVTSAPDVTEKAANKAPTVTLTSPTTGAIFSVGTAITLTASASDSDGSITKVEFYRGGTTLVGTATTAPFRYVWTNAVAGAYSLTAKAYDNRNGTATSAAAAITVVSNQKPLVTLTSPAEGTFVSVGSVVTLAASATDPDGSIASVQFLDGMNPIGTVASLPYQVAWQPSVAGVHSISARAIDDKGGTNQSSSVEVLVGAPPIVIVTNPAACAMIDGPLNLPLTADAMSASGRIVTVAFYDGGTLVGTATAPPWQTTLVATSIGTHAITATATDDQGGTATSRPAMVTVRGANQAPTVTLTAPNEGSHFPFGSNVNLAATAADVDGTITAVEFRLGGAGGSLIARTTAQPFSAIWSNVAPGSYGLVAVAYDDRNAAATSSIVHLTIDANALPTAALTSPVAGTVFVAPADIAVTATASDSDGTIAKVDFYAGTTLIGTSGAPPYATNWTGVAAGGYSITAKATDNAGGTATSSAVAVTVINNVAPTIVLTAPTSGGSYFAPATISLSATATDTDGTIAKVDFYANGSLVGSAPTSPYTFVWDGVAAGTYALTARATDNAGASTTSAPVSVTVEGGPAINIDGALSDATIDDDNVLVRGFVSAPGNSAVMVNGVVTHIDDLGRFQANDVPLAIGSNTVTAVVTTQDGQSTSQAITVNSTGRGLFTVHASPTEGLNSLTVTFTIENPGNVAFKQIFFDLDNDGFPNLIATPAQFSDGQLTVTATYPVGTWLAVIKVFDNQDRVIYSTSKSIVVLLPSLLQGNLRAIYDGMLTRLRTGNVGGALSAFTGSAHDKYEAIFTQLQPTLPSIVDQLGQVSEINFGMDIAELSIVRNTADGPVRFLLYMIRAEDGIWRIDGM